MTGLIPACLADIAASQESAREAFERFMDALDDRWITGNETGEIRGFLAVDDRPPTPAEQAMAILAPHLVHEPLYRTIGTPL